MGMSLSNRKKKVNKTSPKRKRKKTRKLKHKAVEEDWGLEGGKLEEMEEREVARTRFLKSDLSWATVRGTLELEARRLVIEHSGLACELVEAKVVEMTASWLDKDEAAHEFERIPDDWMESDTLPDDWPSIAGPMVRVTPPDDDSLLGGWQAENENFKTFLKFQKYTSRKKSLLKKQISDLKTYLDDHLPRIQEEEQMANIFQFKASNANIKKKPT